MTEHHHAVLHPDVEMSDPQLLVDEGHKLLHFGKAQFRYAHVEGAGEMQRLDLAHPGEGDLIIRPAAGDDDRDLVLAGALERPAVAGRHVLDDVERTIVGVACDLDNGHAASTAPVKWKCARHGTLPRTQPGRAAICRRSNRPPRIDSRPESARTHNINGWIRRPKPSLKRLTTAANPPRRHS